MNYYAGFGVIFLFFTGLYFDQRLKTGYFFAFTGLIIGFIYIGYEIWKITRKD
jgi:hypothetical protein